MAKWARTLRRARRRLMFLSARQLVRNVAFERIPVWGGRIGTWQFRTGGRARDRVLADLARLQGRSPDDPRVSAQLQASYRNYAIATMQVVAICDRKLDTELLKRACRIDGLEHLQAAKEAGKGAILLANHSGNSLILCAQLASLGWPITIVYRQARMMSKEFFAEGLPRYGIEGVAANEGARAYAKMRRAIKNNRIVYVMIDQGVKAGSDGIVARFLGKDIPMPVGPAQLARQSGVPVFPLDTIEAPPVWHFVVGPAVQFAPDSTLEDDVKQLVAINERQILARPEIWSWPHRRWRKFRLAAT